MTDRIRRNGRVALNAVVHLLSGLSVRNTRRIVFGAWTGQRYADNPRRLLEYLLAHHADEFELVWCGNSSVRAELPPEVVFVERGSVHALSKMLTASFCFVAHGTSDLGPITPVRGATMVYLGHGMTIKRMGGPTPSGGALRRAVLAMRNRQIRFDVFAASSDEHVRKMVDEFSRYGMEVSKALRSGQPRNDIMVGDPNSSALEIRESYARTIGIPVTRRVISYMPTFRDSREPTFSFAAMSDAHTEALERLLELHDACIVEKKHPAELASEDQRDQSIGRVRLIGPGDHLDTQDLLLVSDVLITDYSGCFIDFLLLDRPVIHFAYDHEHYAADDRGLYYDLEDIAGGEIVTSTDELWSALDRALVNRGAEAVRRTAVRERLLTWEHGTASATIVRRLLDC